MTVNTINYRFPIITPDVEGDPADLVIIAVKGYDLEQAIKDIRNQVGKDTIILSVLNGVESEKQVAAVYGEEHVLYSYMRISIVMKDGKTEFDPHKGSIHFGDLKNDPEHYSENVLAVKNLFDLCGIDYKVDADMLKGIWFKFMCNVAENMTCAMFGVPFGAFQKSDDANYFRHKAMWEVIHVANKLESTLVRTRSTARSTRSDVFHMKISRPHSRIWKPESIRKSICLPVPLYVSGKNSALRLRSASVSFMGSI